MKKKILFKKNKKNKQNIASETILNLFNLAKNTSEKEIEQNSLKLAEQFSKKYKSSIPINLKRSFCKNCYNLYTPNNSTTRIKPGKKPLIIITCNCGKIKRIGFSKDKKTH